MDYSRSMNNLTELQQYKASLCPTAEVTSLRISGHSPTTTPSPSPYLISESYREPEYLILLVITLFYYLTLFCYLLFLILTTKATAYIDLKLI